jgi:transcriptional regulator with XRE-family HTH domain
MGISVERLGDALNLTALQVQRIESGERRAGAATLYDLSRILGVPISYFFGDKAAAFSEPHGGSAESTGDMEADPMLRILLATDETRQLVHAFRQVEPAVRPRILALIKSMAPL